MDSSNTNSSTTTPLLLREDDIETDSKQYYPAASLDQIIEQCMGEFGVAQLFQAILVSMAWLFDAQQTFISVFTDSNTNTNTSDGNSNIISEWGLEESSLKGLPASSFFAGCLVGGLLLATLADSSFGRKKMLFLSCFLMSFSSLLTAFSPNIWAYSALKFLIGFGRATIGTCALVLSTELVGKCCRAKVGVIGFFCFTLGFLSLPALAYINRASSWRHLYLWTSLPTIFYSLLALLAVHESPRWLLLRGRPREALRVIQSIASSRPYYKHQHETAAFLMQQRDGHNHEEGHVVDVYSAMKILVRKSWALKRLLAVMAIGFGVGFVYYGMPLGLEELGFPNLYLSVAFNALVELPSSLLTLVFVEHLNRKASLLVFTVLSGVCSVLCVLVSPNNNNNNNLPQIGLEMVSFFSACTCFNVVLIYSTELFPTCVRNSAISMVRQALVLGGVFSPMLVAAGTRNGLFSYGVFGVVIGLCGVFVVFLPETRGRRICDTLEEEEEEEQEAEDHYVKASDNVVWRGPPLSIP